MSRKTETLFTTIIAADDFSLKFQPYNFSLSGNFGFKFKGKNHKNIKCIFVSGDGFYMQREETKRKYKKPAIIEVLQIT